MKHNIRLWALSLITLFFSLPAMAVIELSTNQEITGLLQNPTFENQFQGWTLTQQGGNLGVQETLEGTFEVQSQGGTFTLEQTLTDLPDGVYELQLDGYFSAEGMPQSTLHGSMFALNDMKNVFMAAGEYTEENPTNRIVAKPENGRLTVKILGRCLASSADVTVFSNLHLFYRGSENEAFSTCTNVLLDMRFSLTTMWECHSTDITDYVQHPSCNASLMKSVKEEAYSTTATFSQILSNLKDNGNLFDAVYESRAAYIRLMSNVLLTENTANLLVVNNLLTEEQYNKVRLVLDNAIQGYTQGSLANNDVETLLQQMASLSGLPAFKDNIMQISTPQDLCSFAVLVNEGMRTLDAQLTADIDMAGIKEFQPIGICSTGNAEYADFYSHSYGGNFNGQGHQILNLSVRTAFEGGLFSRCYRAQISNVGLCNVSITGTGNQTCGALAGTLMQTQVNNCYVAGEIQVSTNGKLSAEFAGEGAWNTVFNNCYTLGGLFTNDTEAELNNCYWGHIATGTALSGELCYNLNQGETLSPVFFQTLGSDTYPVLSQGHEIVKRDRQGNYYNGDEEDAVISVENAQGPATKDRPVYDLTGRRLSRKPANGLFIQDGKVRR